jgi:tetratricopeptide (TPR) repeat protein
MIRVIALAVLLGVLTAGGSLYAGSEMIRQSPIAGWLGFAAETSLATEAWPICTAMTALGTELDWALLDPDFAAGKKALVAEDWNGAIGALDLAVLRDPRNADIQNYIGYAYRRLGQMGPAMGHYQQALTFSPRHRSAREHIGELYLSLGEPIKAEEQLATLNETCLIPCDEVTDLQRAIEAYFAIRQGPRPAQAF